MPVTYTNRKGVTYFLCRGTTKTGKPRYFFAREPKGEPVDQAPEGWQIVESVNGVVSLAREAPRIIRPEELAVVQAALRQHPKAHKYRVDSKAKQIIVYERFGPDLEDIVAGLKGIDFPLSGGKLARLRELDEESARFSPVMRFTLKDEETRAFSAERIRNRGSSEGWFALRSLDAGPIARLAGKLIPTLDSNAFFELY